MSEQPYKLGNPASVGGAAAKAGADIGTAISEGVQAVAGVKKHRNALQHIAEQNQLGHERMIHAMSHADSLAAQAKARGQDMTVKADHSSVEYTSRSVKGPKGTKPPKSAPPKKPKGNTAPPGKTPLALAPGNPPRSPRRADPTPIHVTDRPMLALEPSKSETKPTEATVKPQLALPAPKPMLALGPGKPDSVKASNSRTMKDFTQKKQEARQRAAAERAAGNRPKRSTPKTVAGKKGSPAVKNGVAGKKRSALDKRLDDWQNKYNAKMDDWHARTVANIDRAAGGN
jgi:hypothetical protein